MISSSGVILLVTNVISSLGVILLVTNVISSSGVILLVTNVISSLGVILLVTNVISSSGVILLVTNVISSSRVQLLRQYNGVVYYKIVPLNTLLLFSAMRFCTIYSSIMQKHFIFMSIISVFVTVI